MNNRLIKNNLQSFEQTKSYFLFISGLFMALVHLGSVFFSYGEGYYPTKIVESLFYYARFVAYFNITIPCVAAMTYFTIYTQNKNKPNFRLEYLKTLMKLFIILFLVECFMEIIMNLPYLTLDFYSFAVLQFTGISLIILHLILNYLGFYYLIGFGLFALFSAPWLNEFFRSKNFLIISGSNNYEFQWPLLPWLVVPIFGLLISFIWIKYEYTKRYIFIVSSLIFVMLFGWTKDLVSVQLDTRWGDAVFQPNTLLVIQNLSLVPVLLYLSEKISELRLMKRLDIVDTMSRGILFFYISHVLLTEFILIKLLNNKFIAQSISDQANLNQISLLTLTFFISYFILIGVSVHMTKIYLIIFVDYKWSRGV